MRRIYRGTCRKGLVVFSAQADTAEEQADCARDIRGLIKRGFTVELIDVKPTDTMPEWCLNPRCGTCKL